MPADLEIVVKPRTRTSQWPDTRLEITGNPIPPSASCHNQRLAERIAKKCCQCARQYAGCPRHRILEPKSSLSSPIVRVPPVVDRGVRVREAINRMPSRRSRIVWTRQLLRRSKGCFWSIDAGFLAQAKCRRNLGASHRTGAPAIPGRSTDYLASSGVELFNPGVLGSGREPSVSFTAKLRISRSQLTLRPRCATLLKSSALC